jgi:hypothetical protein
MDQISRFMKAFVLGEQVDLKEFSEVDFIGHSDVVSMRWHHDASKEIRQRAESETNPLERQRLLNLANHHLAKLDRLLERYGQGVDHAETMEEHDKVADRLIAALSLTYR